MPDDSGKGTQRDLTSVGDSVARGENTALAALLDETAELLEAQHANPFRVRAYRAAAAQLRSMDESIRDVWQRAGVEGLVALPHVGSSLARAIENWLTSGALGILLRLRGDDAAERLLLTVPGIGPELARRIHHDLHITTLEELEQSAHDGRLEAVPGLGERRVRSIRDQLGARLGRRRLSSRRSSPAGQSYPPVATILEIDSRYRELVALDQLPKIAPRRFNPEGEAWLPIFHTQRDGHHFTALYSNTARAHELGRTRDWVVIYLDDGDSERQWTVVTERRGPLAGKRVVRGREAECASVDASS